MSERHLLERLRSWLERKRLGKELISFQHMGRQRFSVTKEARGIATALIILDRQHQQQGIIHGIWFELPAEIQFRSIAVQNSHRGDASHVPYLIGTAIGELVAQKAGDNKKIVKWSSDTGLHQTDDGQKMYESLIKETVTEAGRFHNRLQIQTQPCSIGTLTRNSYILTSK